MIRARSLRICLGVALMTLSSVGRAQSCTINSNGNGMACTTSAISVPLSIAKTTQLLVSTGTAFSLAPSAGILQPADYAAGFYNVAATITVTARSNAPWNATVAATSATFGAPCATKPAAQLLWGTATASRTNAMTTAAATIFSGGATAGSPQQVFFRVNVSWTADPPSICSLPLSFAIAAL